MFLNICSIKQNLTKYFYSQYTPNARLIIWWLTRNSMYKYKIQKKCTSDKYLQNLPIVTLSVVFIWLVRVAGTVQSEVFFNTDAHKIASQRTILRQNSVARGEDAESVYISFCEDVLTNQLDLSCNGFFIIKVDSKSFDSAFIEKRFF